MERYDMHKFYLDIQGVCEKVNIFLLPISNIKLTTFSQTRENSSYSKTRTYGNFT